MSLILFWGGIAVALAGGILQIVAAFGEGALWGLGVMFIPGVSLIFVMLHWEEAKMGFIVSMVGGACLGLGLVTMKDNPFKPKSATAVSAAAPSSPSKLTIPEQRKLEEVTQPRRIMEDCASEIGMFCRKEMSSLESIKACLQRPQNAGGLKDGCKRALR